MIGHGKSYRRRSENKDEKKFNDENNNPIPNNSVDEIKPKHHHENSRRHIIRSKSTNYKTSNHIKQEKNHEKNLMSTKIEGKTYWHEENVDLEKLSCHLPIHDHRKDLRVTLIKNYIFYHDRQIFIQASNSKVIELIKKLTKLNTTESETESIIEYSLKVIPLSSVSFETHKCVTENSVNWFNNCYLNYEAITKEENERLSEIKSSRVKRDKENKIELDTHKDTIRIDEEKKSKHRKDWDINGWIKGAHRNFKECKSSTSPALNKLNNDICGLKVSNSAVSENITPKKLTVSEISKKSILSFIGLKFGQKSEKKNPINIESISEEVVVKKGTTLIKEDNPKNNKEDKKREDLNKSDSKIRSPLLHRLSTRNQMNKTVETITQPRKSYIRAKKKSESYQPEFIHEIDCCNPTQSFEFSRSSNTRGVYIKDEMKNFFQKKNIKWKDVTKNLVDTHCHFDMLFAKIRYKNTVSEYFKDFSSIYIDNFEACINILCDPSKFKTSSMLNECLRIVKHPKVFSAIGCHPHFADKWTDEIERIVYSALNEENIVAIGECGLDSSRKNSVSMEHQKIAFAAQLQIAYETKKTIVIHCRDMEMEVFYMLKEYLDPDHRIHLHCFTGGWLIGQKYLKKFPNLCIGVTPLVTFKTSDKVKDVIRNIPLNRLLLETDSPYFVPQTIEFPSGIETSHPAFIYSTVECVATMRDISLNDLLKYNRDNIKKVYNF